MCTNPRKLIVNKEEIIVKCGKCETCRRERSQEWAIKLINEAKYHKKVSFITLTFDNKILKKGNKYGANCTFLFHIKNSKDYFTKFIKRLRKHYKGTPITYYRIGEYGSKTKRCHYHMLCYGVNFEEDRKEYQSSKTGHIQYVSETLNKLWACGICTIQDACPSNIMYIAQYCIKKINDNDPRYKEIQSFSNRSKISVKWFRRNYKEIEKGYILDNEGKKYRIPRSYINECKKEIYNENIEGLKESYRKYENNIMERISNTTTNEFIKIQKNREKIQRRRKDNFNKIRDF